MKFPTSSREVLRAKVTRMRQDRLKTNSKFSLIMLAFLMYYKKMSLCESILHVRLRRPIMNPNNGFLRQLYSYETQLFAKNSVDPSLFQDDYGSGAMFISG